MSEVMIGRNTNTHDVATVTSVTVNSVTATTLAVANEKRIFFHVSLEPGVTNEDAFIRLYPAGTDDLSKGMVLSRDTFGNSNLFKPAWEMTPDNVYTGEISAISLNGTFNLLVTEY
jgi:hypothetical protein